MGNFIEEWKLKQREMDDRLPPDLREMVMGVNVADCLLDLEQEFAAGDISAALKVVHLCVMLGEPPEVWPGWARDYFVNVCNSGYEGELKSWDEVFGTPYTSEKYRRKVRDEHFPWVIYESVKAATKDGRPIDDKLFEEIGRKLGVGGKTLVKELYAKARDGVGEVEKGIAIHKARMEIVYRTAKPVADKTHLLDKVFRDLAEFLQIDEPSIRQIYADALKAWGDIAPTPQKPLE